MPSQADEHLAEHIPDEDNLTRAHFETPEQIAPESYFHFGHDKKRDERAESFYWRKYAPLASDIHRRGCNLELVKQKRAPNIKYVGCRSVKAGGIRAIETGRGHKLVVFHFPENGDNAHSHVAIKPAKGTTVKNVNKNDILELANLVVKVLSDLEPHSC